MRARLLASSMFLGSFAAAFGQVSVMMPNSFEIGGFLGASYGVDKTRIMGGGNVTYAINKYILPYAEYSYFPGIGREQSGVFPGTGSPFTYKYSIPLSDFHGGVHIRIPIKESPVVPYLVFGAGALKSFDHTVTARYVPAGGPEQSVPLTVPGRTDFAINFGGGLRYYVTQRFGFRVEAKAYRPTGTFDNVFGKVEGGIFIQLR
ncbi:MAG: hypothetical protein R2729_21200 [Bryobacteraceae bacterium]